MQQVHVLTAVASATVCSVSGYYRKHMQHAPALLYIIRTCVRMWLHVTMLIYSLCDPPSPSFLPTEVVIGFVPSSYTVREDEGTVTLTVRVIRGRLDSDITVEFNTSPGTAVGESHVVVKTCLSQTTASH